MKRLLVKPRGTRLSSGFWIWGNFALVVGIIPGGMNSIVNVCPYVARRTL